MTSAIAGAFGRVEPRKAATGYLRGLLSEIPRKTCWDLSKHAGYTTPDVMQRLLSRATWDEDAVRDAVRRYVIDHLASPDAVLVLDETGQEKKGVATCGVGRQYTGTAGKVTNCIVAVYATYASPLGHALIDTELYVQRKYVDLPATREAMGLPDDWAFATKPQLAQRIAARAVAAGVHIAWAAGDEVYGRDPKLRAFLEQQQIGYVLAVGVDFPVATAAGSHRAGHLAALVSADSWERRSCGAGSKGPRVYDWAMVATTSARHVLLIRRSVSDPSELAFFYSHVPEGRVLTLSVLVKIAGVRWAVEEDFQQSKGQAGLDHAQVRRYRSWRRHVILVMAALAVLAVVAAVERGRHPAPVVPCASTDAPPGDYGLIALTVPEVRRLLTVFTQLTAVVTPRIAALRRQFELQWSIWRRRHQARARWHHYRRRLART
ncbi:IS701 family transposase [Microbispora hainanensis]|uniref:IS701 family transposase n=1 Tax=Microbispora hainanensis TaxID=568844 RepID=A0ABZ1T6D4_9ACTN|nr:IS701 family transposase [Microbispora hainanensis]